LENELFCSSISEVVEGYLPVGLTFGSSLIIIIIMNIRQKSSLNLISGNDFGLSFFSRHFRPFGQFAYEFSRFKSVILFENELLIFKSIALRSCFHMNFRFDA